MMLRNESRKHWYALKVFYNRVGSVEDYLRQREVQTYVPLRSVETVTEGRKGVVRKPAVSSLMFIRESERFVLELQNRMKSIYPLMAYFDRETKKPAVISDGEMNAFMLVASTGDSSLEYFNDEEYVYRSGDKVRVTGGIFEGAEGYVKRIRGNRRLVVSIEGVVAVATAYIPGCFLEKME